MNTFKIAKAAMKDEKNHSSSSDASPTGSVPQSGKPFGFEFGPYNLLREVGELGDALPFSRLYEEYQNAVYRFLDHRNGLHCHEDSQDMVQEVFLRAWRGRKDFRGDSSAKTYLLAIAKIVLQETWRKNSKHQRTSSYLRGRREQTPVENDGDAKRCTSIINEAISRLSQRQQNVIRLVLIESRSRSEAARMCDCSPDAIRHRLAAALKHLRNSLSLCSVAKCPHNVLSSPNDCPAECLGFFCLKHRVLQILDKIEKS